MAEVYILSSHLLLLMGTAGLYVDSFSRSCTRCICHAV